MGFGSSQAEKKRHAEMGDLIATWGQQIGDGGRHRRSISNCPWGSARNPRANCLCHNPKSKPEIRIQEVRSSSEIAAGIILMT